MSGQFKQCTLHLACLDQIVNNLTSSTTCRILEIAVLYLYRSEPRRVIVKCSAWGVDHFGKYCQAQGKVWPFQAILFLCHHYCNAHFLARAVSKKQNNINSFGAKKCSLSFLSFTSLVFVPSSSQKFHSEVSKGSIKIFEKVKLISYG